MLGSRYLNPYFGSGIYTWASLISTVLMALTVGYFLGGSRRPHRLAAVLAVTVIIGSVYLLVLPSFAQALLEFVLAGIDDIRAGSLLASLAIMFFPGDLSRHVFAVRDPAAAALGAALRPGVRDGLRRLHRRLDRRHARHHLLPDPGDRLARDHAVARRGGLISGLALLALPRLERAPPLLRRSRSPHGRAASCRADSLIDEGIRAAMLKRPNGRIAHIETEYNDIFITKRQNQLMMSFQLKGWDYTESVTNLPTPTTCRCAMRR